MQSILIWMVFPADVTVGLSVKFSSIGWTEWMADLSETDTSLFSQPSNFVVLTVQLWLFYMVNSLIQHLKQLVEYILAEGVRCLQWLILRHGEERRNGHTRWRVPESVRRQKQPWTYFTKQKMLLLAKKKTRCFKSCTVSKHAAEMVMCRAERIWPPSQWSKGGGGVLLAAIHKGSLHCEEVSLHNTEYLYYT